MLSDSFRRFKIFVSATFARMETHLDLEKLRFLNTLKTVTRRIELLQISSNASQEKPEAV